jgi:tetratricopeptide (TPR) repeat protein
MDQKRRKLQKDLEMWRAKQDPIGEGQTLANLAYFDYQEGNLPAARDKYKKAEELLHAAGDQSSEAALLHERANLELQAARPDAARRFFEQSLQLASTAGNKQVEAAVLHGLAMMDYQANNMEAARKGFEASLTLKQELNDRPNTAATQIMLGQILFTEAIRTRGDRQEALDMLKEAVNTYEDLIMPNEALAGLRILTDLERMDDVLRAEETKRG